METRIDVMVRANPYQCDGKGQTRTNVMVSGKNKNPENTGPPSFQFYLDLLRSVLNL